VVEDKNVEAENAICLLAITSRTVLASAHRAAPWLWLPHLSRLLVVNRL
jgi:hypothetical protein